MTDIIPLNGPELAPISGNKPKQLVILLHGLGSDGNDLIGLAPEFAQILPDAQFISPNAVEPCDMAPYGYQWFSLQSREDKSMYDGAELAAPSLNHFIDSQLKRFELEDKDLAFIGFSQGTMMSLHVALRRQNACASVLGYSGRLLAHSPLRSHIKSKPSIALVHGVIDPVVPYACLAEAVEELAQNNIDVQQLSCPDLQHGIDHEGIKFGKQFLQDCFR